MQDHPSRAGAEAGIGDHNTGQGRNDINVHRAQDLRIWSKRLGVAVETLKEAVSVAGPNADAVQRHLRDSDEDQGQRH